MCFSMYNVYVLCLTISSTTKYMLWFIYIFYFTEIQFLETSFTEKETMNYLNMLYGFKVSHIQMKQKSYKVDSEACVSMTPLEYYFYMMNTDNEFCVTFLWRMICHQNINLCHIVHYFLFYNNRLVLCQAGCFFWNLRYTLFDPWVWGYMHEYYVTEW